MSTNPIYPRTVFVLFNAAFLLISLSTAAAQNLLKDGGFELGLAPETRFPLERFSTAWTVNAGPGGVAIAAGLPDAGDLQNVTLREGTGVLVLVGNVGITQTFPTTTGRQYQVRLSGQSAISAIDSELTIRASGSSGSSGDDLAATTIQLAGTSPWKVHEFTFTASESATTLEMRQFGERLTALDDVSVTLNPLAEVTVFGTDAHKPLSTDAGAGGLVTSMRKGLFPSFFNHANRDTFLFSAISSGTLVVEAGSGIYASTHDRPDIKEVTLMGETVIIRSPWRLKGTQVKIYARELRFEGGGQLITTPNEQFAPPTDATGPNAPGSNGANGDPAGSVDIFVEKYIDASGNGNAKFVLTGGKGQDAGKGRHGADGTSVSGISSRSYRTDSTCDARTYVSQNGYMITYFEMVGDPFVADRVLFGSKTFPTSGQDAWPSGTPGRGGNGGTLRTSNASITGIFGGGQPGAPGAPTPVAAHTSKVLCEGGTAGTPRKSEHVQATWKFLQCPDAVQIDKSETVGGRSFSVVSSSAGAPGARVIVTNPYEWVNPLLMRKILNDIKDDYLQNRISRVQTRLDDYADLIDQYQANAAAWNITEQMTRLELGQIRDEMRRLRQQVANGLDYFGNPAGWVPMLSFEVSSTIFDQEIDRSLDIVYLARWVGKRQDSASAVVAALTTARNKLADEVAEVQKRYGPAKANLDGLKSQAQTLQTRVVNLQNTLQAKDNALHAKAVANTQPPAWETGLRLSLKIAGTACKMIPAYQPALGAVGDGLNLGSDFDPDQPWDTIQQIPDIASTYLTAKADEAAADHASKVAAESMNPAQLAAQNATDARVKKLQDLSNASSQLSAGMKNISGFLERAKAPSPEVDAELEKLKAADPEYGQLVTDIQQLVKDNQDLANKIVAGILEVGELSDLITRNLLAMDGLSARAGQSANLVDDRLNSYLRDMERRAWDRLLKYHYYMAKAYEYRLVTPYTAQLDLKDIYDRIETIAAANPDSTGGVLPDAQKDQLNSQSLHSLFKALIADTTEKIVGDFQHNSYTTGASLNYHLTSGDIAALNRGEALTLNLANRGLFQPGEEDIRIRSISLENVDDIGTEGNLHPSLASVELFIQHSGLSNIRKDGKVYQFRHYSQGTRNLITWRPKYDVLAKRLLLGPVNPAPDSLLRSLAKVGNDQLILYSSPSAWADLTIWRLVNNGGAIFDLGFSNAPIRLTKVRLHVVYDYATRGTATPRRNVEVLAVRAENKLIDTGIDPDAENRVLAPDFKISAADVNGRQDAQGRFLRIYTQNSPAAVTVTAPDRIGNLVFWKWTDNKMDVANSGPAITVTTATDRRLVAFYTPTFAERYQQDFDALAIAAAVPDGSSLTSDTGVARVIQDPDGRTYLRLTDANVGGTRSQLVMQQLNPTTYGFRASFDYAITKPASGPLADGFGFYLKPADEPVDTANNQIGGYARGLGVEFVTFNAPGHYIRVNNAVLPTDFPVSPASDGLWHKVVILYRTAPEQDGNGTLTVTVDGAAILSEVPLKYTPTFSDVFAFVARTGGFAQTTDLDNILITPLASPAAVSSNADLSSLVPDTGTLAPGFASGTTDYTLSVPNATSAITLTPTAADASATIQVNGAAVPSGAASSPINLAAGSNPITVAVTAQDGTTVKNYLVTVTRAGGGTPPDEGAPGLNRLFYRARPGLTLDDFYPGPRGKGVFPAGAEPVGAAVTQSGTVAHFEAPAEIDEDYGQILYGYIVPSETADYTFYLCSDDQGELWLSTDDDPANSRLIATEPGWNPSRTWDSGDRRPVANGRPANVSPSIRLEAGKYYFVEAIMKEAGGGDNLGVAWTHTGAPAPANGSGPIAGTFLRTRSSQAPVPPSGPLLAIGQDGAGLVISWPNMLGFILERTDHLAPDAIWSNVPFTVTGANASAPVDFTGGAAFYRLRLP